MENPILKRHITPRLLLRPPHRSLAWAAADFYKKNKAFLMKTEPFHDASFFTAAGQRHLLLAERKAAKKKMQGRFWVQSRQSGDLLGVVALNNIVMGSFCSCFVSYKLGQEYTGQGFAREAMQKLIQIAFEEMGLHRLEANIMPRNLPSLRLAEALGFENEGLAKKYLQIGGVWEDHIHMVLLQEKYKGVL